MDEIFKAKVCAFVAWMLYQVRVKRANGASVKDTGWDFFFMTRFLPRTYGVIVSPEDAMECILLIGASQLFVYQFKPIDGVYDGISFKSDFQYRPLILNPDVETLKGKEFMKTARKWVDTYLEPKIGTPDFDKRKEQLREIMSRVEAERSRPADGFFDADDVLAVGRGE
ncbi:MAG TPA: hypothetical protein VGB38_02545 [bacterium]